MVKKINFVPMVERDLNHEFDIRDAVSFNGVVIRLGNEGCAGTVIATLIDADYSIAKYSVNKSNTLFVKFN